MCGQKKDKGCVCVCVQAEPFCSIASSLECEIMRVYNLQIQGGTAVMQTLHGDRKQSVNAKVGFAVDQHNVQSDG